MNRVSSVRLACAAAAVAAILSGCSSLPPGQVPIVDRNSGEVQQRPAVGGIIDSGRTHTVAHGDTIYNISQRNGIRPADLMQLNAIVDPTTLSIGQVLHLPVGTGTPTASTVAPGVRVHRVDTSAPITVGTLMPTQSQPAETAEPAPAETAAPAEAEAQPVKAPEPVPEIIPGTRLLWPARGPVISDYAKNGKGIDIGGEAGSIVIAAADGEVIFVGTGVRGYGNLVIVKHTPTLVTAYGHNSKIVVKRGDKVRSGQKIAEMGQTDADRVKLRFELRERGKAIDPSKYLPPVRK